MSYAATGQYKTRALSAGQGYGLDSHGCAPEPEWGRLLNAVIHISLTRTYLKHTLSALDK